MEVPTIASPEMRTFDPVACEPRNLYKLMTGIIVPRPAAKYIDIALQAAPVLTSGHKALHQ